MSDRPKLAAAAAPATAPASDAALVSCPYCTEKIAAAAIVCKHCHRDLVFFMPLRRDIEALKSRVESLEAQNQRLTALLVGDDAPAAVARAGLAVPAATDRDAAPGVVAIVGFLLLPVALLVLAHAAIVMWLDLSQVYLRIVSVALPACMGFAMSARFRVRLAWQWPMAAAIGAIAVTLMTAVIAYSDDQPLAPQDAREWREVTYYVLSIAFGHMTGILAALAVFHRRNNAMERLSVRLAAALTAGTPKQGRAQKLKRYTESIREFITLVTPILTALVSIATGVLSLMKK